MDAPEIPNGGYAAYQAFMDLAADRPWLSGMTMAPRRLPWSVVDAYARRLGIAGEAFDEFWALIQAMDQVWMDEWARLDRAQRTD